MFRGCTSLTIPPKLPAMELEKACYGGMFFKCTSLTKAPILPAVQLELGCYAFMFYKCHNLNYIKAMFLIDYNSEKYYMK